tara:strand:+ start:112 stop:678 length:567 start_codon:yes stop_codon:yes gene_type:complete
MRVRFSYFFILSKFYNNHAFAFKPQMMISENTQIPKLITTLKDNGDNAFVNAPNLSVYKDNFYLTINNARIFDKKQYSSLYQKIRSCKNYISKNTEINNTFQIFPEEYYISTNTVCNFNIRYISKPMIVVMESTYIFDDKFQVIQHNIESVEINNKKVNAMELVNDYLNKRDNKSIIEFMAFIFIKRR